MGNNTLIKGTVIVIIGLIIFTIVMLALVGKNGLINKEKDNYNQTHVEERSEDLDNEKTEEQVVVLKD